MKWNGKLCMMLLYNFTIDYWFNETVEFLCVNLALAFNKQKGFFI